MSGGDAGAGGPIIVVGASLAGMNAAQVLRRGGFEGELTVVGDEPHLPYDRPPLSKDFLTSEVDLDRLTLPPARKLDELDIDLMLGRRAVGLDLDRQVISVGLPGSIESNASGAGSEEISFSGLIVATGARARSLPPSLVDDGVAEVSGMFTLRSLDDAVRLKTALLATEHPVVVCGAGFIGGEVAASARTMGREVVLLEAAEAPLTRVLDAEAGLAMADLHRSHGVDVRLSTSLAAVHHDGSQVSAVTLSDGSTIDTEVVVIGIGAAPNTEWLEDSSLTIDNGVVVDKQCRAAVNVVAAGDIARFPNERFGGSLMRVEQWDNAVEMGRFAATTLLADLGLANPSQELAPAFSPVPWFWSDQYDRKIQLAGVRSDHAVMAQGSYDEGVFARLFHDDERLCGVLTWNRPRQAIIGRQLIDQGVSVDESMEKLGG